MTAPARPGLAEVLCSADDSWPHHEGTDDYPCSACKDKAAVAAQWFADEVALLAAVYDQGFDDLGRTGDVLRAFAAGADVERAAFNPWGDDDLDDEDDPVRARIMAAARAAVGADGGAS